MDKDQYQSLKEVKKNLTFKDLLYIITDGQHNHVMFDDLMSHVAKGCDGFKYKEFGSGGYSNDAIEEIQHTCYVVFEPNAIKSIDNLYPTKDTNFKDNSAEYLISNADKLSLSERREIARHVKELKAGKHDLQNDRENAVEWER